MTENKSFEAMMSELEEIVRKLEMGQVPLEEAVSYYEKGVKLKAVLEKTLSEARMKISKLDENGNIVEESGE